MPPIISPNLPSQNGYLQMDFLLPTGILVPMNISNYATLDILKKDLWKEAFQLPLSHLLEGSDSYSFICINELGVKEELLDESQCLNDIQPFATVNIRPFLKLVQKQGDERSKTLIRNINSLVGKGPQKMEAWSPAEVNEFKTKMLHHCESVIQNKKTKGWVESLRINHPQRLRSTWELPPNLKSKLSNDCIVVDIRNEITQTTYKLKQPSMGYPADFILAALKKWSQNSGQPLEDPDNYVLKAFGYEDYLYGDYPLQQFKYVYTCLCKTMAPEFWLLRRDELVGDVPPPLPQRRPSKQNTNTGTINRKTTINPRPETLVWDIHQKYYLTIGKITNIQLADIKVKLFVGLYNGSEALCEIGNTEDIQISNSTCNILKDIKFNINVSELPSSSRICFALYPVGNKKNEKDMVPVAWVNIPVYDFRCRLVRGELEMDMWSVTDDKGLVFDEICHVLGTVAPNPFGHDSAKLSVKFPDFNINSTIMYPPYEKVLECAATNMEPFGTPGADGMSVSKFHIEQLQLIIDRDPLTPLFEQDKELLWLLRNELRDKYPHALPKLLSSVKWNNHIDVAKMAALIQAWPTLPVDYALELLDYNFPDENVRSFAIKCLDEKLSDNEMFQYLLQLVQAVKYEIYLDCPLVKFLLSRAVVNQHIGQQFFWHLKSEMHEPTVMVRFRLISEVYLKSSRDHLLILLRQSQALEKLKNVNEKFKTSKYNLQDSKSKEKTLVDMRKILNEPAYYNGLSNLYSPLSPIYKLKHVLTDKCKIFNSKKRPLHVVWSNDDTYGNEVNLIFKNGDDLRQDMLTLQILQMMDNIWLAEGLDLRMNPYGCLSTGLEQGMIEVVTKSDTIANIQHWYNKGAFNNKALFEWLKVYNPTPESLDTAVEEFTLSCAGYCVATYVLGIGDRHNDNIMLKQSGQLFHIDFGHFLGNFKSKFGIRRERVPFVLTTHFVHVIQKGSNSNDINFKGFQKKCEQAYLILRRKGHLLFSLFMMMLSSGIPQLTCTRDVEYLRETLVPHLTELEALNHFRLKFQEALKGSWTTSLNFSFHMKAKNNT